jgi:hypothetical protein
VWNTSQESSSKTGGKPTRDNLGSNHNPGYLQFHFRIGYVSS